MTTAAIDRVVLSGREIPVVLESWGYDDLAAVAWAVLRERGWHHQVEFEVLYGPEGKPVILDGHRLHFEAT